MSSKMIVNKPFADVLARASKAITENGFLLIHEINTTAIMQKAGYTVPEVRQLLFFHPRYMEVILNREAEAVIRVPLKIVLFSEREDETVVTYTHPKSLFVDFVSLKELSKDLQNAVEAVVKTIEG